ncbi:MAG: VWA domain-containing protein [Syntrophales bacterium]|nr:VWA domain-containing protein [Syntrophales bacterium]
MDRVLEQFVTVLRRSGVRVSVSETMDAVRAAALSGYEDRQLLKDVLGASLAKTRPEKRIFEECFDVFFNVESFGSGNNCSRPPGTAPAEPSGAPLTQMLLSGSGSGLALAFREAAQASGIKDIRYPFQRGLYMQKLLQAMGLDGLNGDIQDQAARGGPEAAALAKTLEAMRDELMDQARDLVERQLDLYASRRYDEMLERQLSHTNLSALEERDLIRMQAIVQRLVKRLKDRYSRRPKVARRGQLDLKRTMRRNIVYGGIPFDPRWKDRRIERPELVVLCDVSRSVSNVVRFLLLILYSLNEVISRIRSFAFCTNLVEVSACFGKYAVHEAISRILSGEGLPLVLRKTDYGRSLAEFREQHADCLSRRATVVILGDARSNFGNPRTDILRFVSERCRRLIWLNPESPLRWESGDSEMKKYRPYCTLVRECSTLHHLELVVGSLLHR